jgi:hypothetical protein
MIKLLITIFITSQIFAATISGSQDRLSIAGGNMNVTSSGVTKQVNSGQITFISNGKAPTDARKLKANDLSNITDELSMSDEARLVNLNFPPLKPIIAKKIKRFLIKAGITKHKFTISMKKNKTTLKIKQININKIKGIYPLYYKALTKYYLNNKKKLSKNSKTPTVKIKLNLLKRYHKSIFNRYR